ncbi:MAG: ATP-binding protein, partial [Candidatus Thorarchaeota archaeon]
PLNEWRLDEVLCESMKNASILLDDVMISLSLHVTEARTRADEYLELLLSDLLVNAFDGHTSEMKRIWVDLKEEGDFYVLSVSDIEPGVEDGAGGNMVDLGSRSEGPGLNLARHIMRKYGGAIDVMRRMTGDSSQGRSIRVSFPRSE